MQNIETQEEAQGEEYIRRPYAFFHDGYKGYGGAIAGLIYSYSNSKKRPNATFVGSQMQIAERVGCSRSTVSRKIAELKGVAGFTQTTMSPSGRRLPCAVYTYAPEGESAPYMTTNMKLYEEKQMSPATVDVFSHILTQYQSPKNGKNIFYGTPSSIASALNIHENTARKALKTLYHLKYVFRKVTVVNGYGTNQYIIPDKVANRYRTPFPSREDKEKKVVPSQRDSQYDARQAADDRTERERYYALLDDEKERQKGLIRARLFSDIEYANADKEEKKLDIKIAKAEVWGANASELNLMRKRIIELQAQKKAVMRRLQIYSLSPPPHCRKCSDTGVLPDGRMCNCYLKIKK